MGYQPSSGYQTPFGRPTDRQLGAGVATYFSPLGAALAFGGGSSNSIPSYGGNAKTHAGLYQGGLQTTFGRRADGYGQDYSGAFSDDPDVMAAQELTNENAQAAAGQNEGVDSAANNAKIDMYKGRIGLKNSLAEKIANGQNELRMANDSVTGAGNAALDSGVRNTRQNFNNRGLLYSGMREGGEQAVKGAVASEMASGYAGASRDVGNEMASAKNAYAAVDLANQQEQLKLANSAFDTASANNIARLQAMQQLGSGVGYAGGTIAGGFVGGNNNNMNFTQLQQPQLGSQYSPQTSYGLLNSGGENSYGSALGDYSNTGANRYDNTGYGLAYPTTGGY